MAFIPGGRAHVVTVVSVELASPEARAAGLVGRGGEVRGGEERWRGRGMLWERM